MSEIAERYRRVAAGFTARATQVDPAAWDNVAPCVGWLARDVVRHMVEWMQPFFLDSMGITVTIPPVDDDPAAAWLALDGALQAGLDDPEISAREFESPAGRHRFEDALSMFGLADVLVHTWDLARATGLDETIDPGEVHDLLIGIEPMDEVLRSSGHYGPRVHVPADADEQTQLIAFMGRQP